MADTSINRTKQFSQVYPYTYTIVRKSDGLQYHGVRWANIKMGLSPIEDFGKKYYSSGMFKKEYKKNPEKFEVVLRWTFDTKQDALLWESRVNKKLIHKSKWANIAVGKGSADSEKMNKRREETLLKRYGVNHNFLIDSVRIKRDNTIEKIYGVRNVGESPEIRQKVIDTTKKKFGVECSFQSEKVKKKIKTSMIKNYGVDNPRKSKVICEKMRQNSIKKFGCEHTFQRNDVKYKILKKREEMYIKLAKMTELEFLNYLKTISQEKSVQNQKITQRNKGTKILEDILNG